MRLTNSVWKLLFHHCFNPPNISQSCLSLLKFQAKMTSQNNKWNFLIQQARRKVILHKQGMTFPPSHHIPRCHPIPLCFERHKLIYHPQRFFHIVLILKLSSQPYFNKDATHTSILLLFQTFSYKVIKFSLVDESSLLQQSLPGSPIKRMKNVLIKACDNSQPLT